MQFAEAYRAPNSDSLRDALQRLASESRERLGQEHAELLLGSASRIPEIADEEAAASPFGNVAATLNMPCLVSFLMMTEGLGQLGFHTPIRIVHDQQHAYGEGYRRIFEIHRGIPRDFGPLPGGEISFGRLDSVAEFEMVDSRERLPVQAADILAGTLNHLLRVAMSDRAPTDTELDLAKMTFPALLESEIKIAWPLWSDECAGRIGRTLLFPGGKADRQSPSTDCQQERPYQGSGQLLPVTGRTKKPQGLYSIPTTIYAIEGSESQGLLILKMPAQAEARFLPGGAGLAAALFSTRESAASLLEGLEDISEPQEIVKYSTPKIPDLLDKVEEAGSHTPVVVFDPLTDSQAFLDLHGFVRSSRTALTRGQRLIRSGLAPTLSQRFRVGNKEALSLLLSSGLYGAMILPEGEVYVGSTREEAEEALKAAKDGSMP